MVNTEIRLIIFFAAKLGEALYSQQKQDWGEGVRRGEGGGFRMGGTGVPVADSFRGLAELIQYCKV